MSTNILTITREYTTKTGRRGVCYTIKGAAAATFIPTACEDVLGWLLGSLGLGAETLEDIIAATDEDDWEIDRWTKHGHDRVYVTLISKLNGGRNWNGGIGNKWWVCLKTGKIENVWRWAGAKTRKRHEGEANELLRRIAALAA
jgi:hypothetical protein